MERLEYCDIEKAVGVSLARFSIATPNFGGIGARSKQIGCESAGLYGNPDRRRIGARKTAELTVRRESNNDGKYRRQKIYIVFSSAVYCRAQWF